MINLSKVRELSMKKISEYFKNSKIAFFISTINLIIIFYCLIGIKEINIKYIIIIILGILPTLVGIILVIISTMYKEKLKNLIKILSILLIIPYLLYIGFWFFTLCLIVAVNPEIKISSYEKHDFLSSFPSKIPDNYENASYYHSYPFLQGGDNYILYLKLDSNAIKNYEAYFNLKQIEPNKDMNIANILYINTPYEKSYLDEYFKAYFLKSECDNSGWCNHGIDEHVMINVCTNEIIFYYDEW